MRCDGSSRGFRARVGVLISWATRYAKDEDGMAWGMGGGMGMQVPGMGHEARPAIAIPVAGHPKASRRHPMLKRSVGVAEHTWWVHVWIVDLGILAQSQVACTSLSPGVLVVEVKIKIKEDNKIDTISYHRIAWQGRANLPKKPRSKREADGNP
ncbi:hypothetical protein J7T55_000678 [Diaporthe amygdali]|uniref:uncharacterized protein n=1 Tax=Phomopsis amygdali TaxID=1214568 RepID=UPI0022FE0130|nr:uncharacterized protein J7T55_000678 [Diaporthe amygdali]KAJ0110245.1 hypothetical protein J7T55_000678 [Diaporthe amygdali]